MTCFQRVCGGNGRSAVGAPFHEDWAARTALSGAVLTAACSSARPLLRPSARALERLRASRLRSSVGAS